MLNDQFPMLVKQLELFAFDVGEGVTVLRRPTARTVAAWVVGPLSSARQDQDGDGYGVIAAVAGRILMVETTLHRRVLHDVDALPDVAQSGCGADPHEWLVRFSRTRAFDALYNVGTADAHARAMSTLLAQAEAALIAFDEELAELPLLQARFRRLRELLRPGLREPSLPAPRAAIGALVFPSLADGALKDRSLGLLTRIHLGAMASAGRSCVSRSLRSYALGQIEAAQLAERLRDALGKRGASWLMGRNLPPNWTVRDMERAASSMAGAQEHLDATSLSWEDWESVFELRQRLSAPTRLALAVVAWFKRHGGTSSSVLSEVVMLRTMLDSHWPDRSRSQSRLFWKLVTRSSLTLKRVRVALGDNAEQALNRVWHPLARQRGLAVEPCVDEMLGTLAPLMLSEGRLQIEVLTSLASIRSTGRRLKNCLARNAGVLAYLARGALIARVSECGEPVASVAIAIGVERMRPGTQPVQEVAGAANTPVGADVESFLNRLAGLLTEYVCGPGVDSYRQRWREAMHASRIDGEPAFMAVLRCRSGSKPGSSRHHNSSRRVEDHANPSESKPVAMTR